MSCDKPTMRNGKVEQKEKLSTFDVVMGILCLAIWIVSTAGGLWFLQQ